MIRSQIPRFRLPETVIDEEVGYITGIGGIETCYGQQIESLYGVSRGLRCGLHRHRRAARARPLYPWPMRGRRERPYWYRLASERLLRSC